MKQPILYYGNPVLRKKAEPIKEITDEIRQIAQDLIDTCRPNNGAGLAAPQIGRSVRMFLLYLATHDKDGAVGEEVPYFFINPELSSPGSNTLIGAEGCLSIPEFHAEVERPDEIHVKAMDLEGNTFEKTLYGWEAREVMHENDHLNGVLYVDRIPAKERRSKGIDDILAKIKKKYAKK